MQEDYLDLTKDEVNELTGLPRFAFAGLERTVQTEARKQTRETTS